ncbi:MAG TPA: SpoIIE family protein phosphatase, partial [Mycobacterium sp.]|nr:SpoIIE family protein phosphatase [Mycobacterium sp.]
DILGYDSEHLPYEPMHPWWPDAATDPDAHRELIEAFASMLESDHGSGTVPVTHRDGRRLWVTFSFNQTDDPETGRRVIVGSFRDVTAEHYRVQREAALAELNLQLAQADTLDDALGAALEELRRLWHARRVVAATFAGQPVDADSASDDVPQLTYAGQPTQWTDMIPRVRQRLVSLCGGGLLSTDTTEPGTAAIALQHPRGVLVLYLELAEPRLFTAEDDTLLTVLAGRLGQGLQRVYQLGQQRETALALQAAILGPATLPGGFAARYQPAAPPLQVGGDWYDIVDLDDGRIALIVGDCVGHGLGAATVMGQLRSACRALLLEHPSPCAALTALDRFANQLPGARTTTAFCAVLTSETGELAYSSAGHPPPIVVHADQTVELLGGGRAIPLGLDFADVRPEAHCTLPPRATLLLYTDGLVERRRESLDRGIARAAGVLSANSASTIDDLANLIMTRLAPEGGYADDVAMLLYRQPAPLRVDIPADASELAATRAALRRWLTRAGVDPDKAVNVLIAAGEALANAIEHGHRGQAAGVVRLRAMVLGDRLRVTVADNGSWKPPQLVANPYRGRGIALMRGLMHDVDISSSADGTTVAMHMRIA